MRPPIMPTAAELERAAVHEARAALAGREECACRRCRRVVESLAADSRSRAVLASAANKGSAV